MPSPDNIFIYAGVVKFHFYPKNISGKQDIEGNTFQFIKPEDWLSRGRNNFWIFHETEQI